MRPDTMLLSCLHTLGGDNPNTAAQIDLIPESNVTAHRDVWDASGRGTKAQVPAPRLTRWSNGWAGEMYRQQRMQKTRYYWLT
jgi:hypothetical protein